MEVLQETWNTEHSTCTKIWSRIVVQCQKALVCKFQKIPMKGEEMQERCMGKTNKMRVL